MISKNHLSITKTASKDKVRPVLNCVYVKKLENSKLRLTTTDGFVLTEKILEIEYTPDFEELLIPIEQVEDVQKVMSSKEHVEIYHDKFIILHKFDEAEPRTMTLTTYGGLFPDYSSITPPRLKNLELTVDVKLLKRVIDANKGADNLTVQMPIHIDSKTGLPVSVADGIIIAEPETENTSILMPLKKR